MSSENLSRSSLRISGYLKSAVAISIIAAGIFWAVHLQDDVPKSYGYGVPALSILIPLLLVVGVVALLNKFIVKHPLRQRIGKTVGWLAVIVGSMTLSAILFLAVVKGIDHWKYVAAQRYAANAVTLLNDIKARTGSYPRTLPADKLGPLPTNLSYGTDGKIGGFLYFDEDGEGIFTYDCGTKTWHYETGGF